MRACVRMSVCVGGVTSTVASGVEAPLVTPMVTRPGGRNDGVTSTCVCRRLRSGYYHHHFYYFNVVGVVVVIIVIVNDHSHRQ